MAGQLVHFEVQAEDPDRAASFYRSVFGWDFQDSGMPGIDYRMVRTGETQGGGLYQSDDRTGHLIVYFDTDDIDGAIAKVRESGGQADEKQPIPGVGWFASAKDTEGNAFSIFQSDESVPTPGQ
jgi:predicted enzyme related to lactoylglutathione lyase